MRAVPRAALARLIHDECVSDGRAPTAAISSVGVLVLARSRGWGRFTSFEEELRQDKGDT